MIDSAKQASALITDVLLLSLSLHLHIEGLEFHRLSESGVEPWQDWAGRIDLIAELALVFELLHVIEFNVNLSGLIRFTLGIRDGAKYFLLLFTHLSLL